MDERFDPAREAALNSENAVMRRTTPAELLPHLDSEQGRREPAPDL